MRTLKESIAIMLKSIKQAIPLFLWLWSKGIIGIFIILVVVPTFCAINYDDRVSKIAYISQIIVSIGIAVICGMGLDLWYKNIQERNAKKYNKLFFMELKPVLEDYLNDCFCIYGELTPDEDGSGRFYLPIEPTKFLNVFFVPKLQEHWGKKDSFLLSGKKKHSLLGGLKISVTFLTHGLESKLIGFMTVLPQKNIDEILNINNSIGARYLQVGVIDLASEGQYYDAKKENIPKESVNIDDVKEYIERVAILFETYNGIFTEQSIRIPGRFLYVGRNGSGRYFESGKYDCCNQKYV